MPNLPKLNALKLITAAGVAVLSVLAVAPGSAHAGAGASAIPSIMSPLVVGDTGSAQIVIENRNENLPGEPFDFETATNIVCNEINPPGTNCAPTTEGITYTPACGATGMFSVCSQPDPDVLSLLPSATGIDGTCTGMLFDVTAMGDALGRYLFTPQALGQVSLPGRGARCVIEFQYTVVKLPTVDADANLAGVQTIAITDHTQSVVGTVNSASARGQSFPITVNRAMPLLNTIASPGGPLGGELTDTAVVSGLVLPDGTGTVSFALYGPDDPLCAGVPVFEDLNVVYSAPSVESAPYSPVDAGTHRWVASYSGDSNNDPVTGTCGDPTETIDVDRAQPAINTVASADLPFGGGDLTDTATVTGLVNPQAGATVDFRLYGPDDATCSSAPVFESLGVDYPVAGGPVSSATFTPTAPGTYRWVAEYSGDVNNEPASGTCGEPTEMTVVERATPSLVTTASPDMFLGDPTTLTDIATVTGTVDPIGGATIDFRLYGPNDTACSGTPIFESLGVPYPVAGGPVSSAAFTPTVAGTYRWVATYSGDTNNAPVTGVCGDPDETTEVASTPDLDTDLPETGSQHLRTMLTFGSMSMIVGFVLLTTASRRRQLPLSR